MLFFPIGILCRLRHIVFLGMLIDIHTFFTALCFCELSLDMEKRSDLRNPDFFPPALDSALVIYFLAFISFHSTKKSTFRVYILLLFILPFIPTEAPVAVQSVACKPSFSQRLLKRQAEQFQ